MYSGNIINMFLISIILLLLLFYTLYNLKRKKKGFIFAIIAGCGLGNKIAGIPGTFILSLLSNRQFHSIFVCNMF